MYVAKIYPLGWWPSVWGGALTLLLFVGVSLVTRPPAIAGQFIADVEKELVAYRFRFSKTERRR
jgi:SSS family solute:Na+ symporter